MKKILNILLMGILIIGLTSGCNVREESDDSNDNKEMNDFSIPNLNDSDTTENTENEEDTDYYVGTYYMALTDGSLAKDGTGTVILNKDKSCTYYYGLILGVNLFQ